MLDAIARPLMPFAMLPVRLAMGAIFIGHGGQKLFGWFGGGGFADTVQQFNGLVPGMPGWLAAGMGGGGELLGGLLLLLGLFTRFGAILIAGSMVVAITTVHWSGGLFAENGGFEYPLSLLASAICIGLLGPGAMALDDYVSLQFHK